MRWSVLSLTLALFVACSPADSTSSVENGLHPVQIAGHTLEVELAITPEEQAKGLMFRKDLPENQGMLFVFDEPRQASFWMKNTFIPLSIAYLDSEGVILEIYRMTPLDKTSITSRSLKVAYALEVNRGWFEKRGIRPGDKLTQMPFKLL